MEGMTAEWVPPHVKGEIFPPKSGSDDPLDSSDKRTSASTTPVTVAADGEKAGKDRWDEVRKSTATTTGVALVLFGAPIVSWLGMWDGVHRYRTAIASKFWAQKRNEKLDDANDAIM